MYCVSLQFIMSGTKACKGKLLKFTFSSCECIQLLLKKSRINKGKFDTEISDSKIDLKMSDTI